MITRILLVSILTAFVSHAGEPVKLDFSTAEQWKLSFQQANALAAEPDQPGVGGLAGRVRVVEEIEELRFRGSPFSWGVPGERLLVEFKFKLEKGTDGVASVGIMVPGRLMNNSGGTMVMRYVCNAKVGGLLESTVDGRRQKFTVPVVIEPERVYLLRARFAIELGDSVRSSLELHDCGPSGTDAPRLVAELPSSDVPSSELAGAPKVEVGIRVGGANIPWIDDFLIESGGAR